MTDEKEDPIQFAMLPEDNIVIRVTGKGTFKNSLCVKQLIDKLLKDGKKPNCILDLKDCITMDSTFMGVIAGVCRNLISKQLGKVSVVNLNEQTERLLSTLGLNFILELHNKKRIEGNFVTEQFDQSAFDKLSKKEQIIHTLQAHEELAKIDPVNEGKFQSVIYYLKLSLEAEDDTNN